jgi:uncharacterized protein
MQIALSQADVQEFFKPVDRALEFAQSCGVRVTKPDREVFLGGYSGYFADPDGHLREVAFNPIFPLDAGGHLVMPQPKSEGGA